MDRRIHRQFAVLSWMFDRVRHLETRYAARSLGHFDTSQRIEPERVHLFEHIASHDLRSRVPPPPVPDGSSSLSDEARREPFQGSIAQRRNR